MSKCCNTLRSDLILQVKHTEPLSTKFLRKNIERMLAILSGNQPVAFQKEGLKEQKKLKRKTLNYL